MTAPPLPYATPEDLDAWFAGGEYEDETPTGAAAGRVLRRASELIAWYTTGGYDTTPDPVPNTVTSTLRDATCAQVEQWAEIGEETSIAGWAQNTTLTLGFSVDHLPPDLAPRAARLLAMGGLLNDRGYSAAGGAGVTPAPVRVEAT